MEELAIRGGRVFTANGIKRLDVLVKDGKIAALEKEIPAKKELSAIGCIVSPGFVDMHTHLRQPGSEEAETIESGTKAAALGGYTAVLAMPNTSPAIDSPSVVREIAELAKTASCEVYCSGAITLERKGEMLAPLAEMADLGVRIFTDDGTGVQDDGLMRRALEYASDLGVCLAQHCEVKALALDGQMNEGEWSARLGLKGIPAEAEELMVSRDIALSKLTGCAVHFQHLSTSGSVDLVKRARASGIEVTCEAAPHHFCLTEDYLAEYDAVYKVNPPLRTSQDVNSIKQGLNEGVIDAIATDHAPHPDHLKELPFDLAPPGMLGLETALALTLSRLNASPEAAINLLSVNPAFISKMNSHGQPLGAGAPANICVFDPSHKWQVDKFKSPSRSSNNPYHGWQLEGKVLHTILDGKTIVENAELVKE